MTDTAPIGEVAASLDEVFGLFERFGGDHYDETLRQNEHALQAAALARRDGASDALVAAALLHDVGHLLDLAAGGTERCVDLAHEATGARYLSALFAPQVTGPIALHVRAKRYRCAVDPTYLDSLSPGSTRSLERQGGPLTSSECRSFEANPGWRDAVSLRGWDDAAKVDGLDVGTLDDHCAMLEQLVVRS